MGQPFLLHVKTVVEEKVSTWNCGQVAEWLCLNLNTETLVRLTISFQCAKVHTKQLTCSHVQGHDVQVLKVDVDFDSVFKCFSFSVLPFEEHLKHINGPTDVAKKKPGL